ncbi:glycerophosphodiester phosphodiesterase [Streptosporangium sandarakinum]
MFRRPGLVTRIALTAVTVTAAVVAAVPSPATPTISTALTASAAPAVTDIAHRGASAYAPENTVAAFELAARQRADMFELDVQETADHKLVLMHDTTLARTTDVEKVFPGREPWRVGDFTLAEIRRLDAGSWFSVDYRDEPVPTLGEVLDAMADKAPGLLLEIKEPRLYPGVEARVADELRDHPSWLSPGRLMVQSFDWNSMRTFHRLMPEVPIGLLGTPPIADLPKLAEYADLINPPYGGLTRDYVRRVHSYGMGVLTWTVNDTTVARRLVSYGVDGVITNRPDVMRQVVSR